MRKLALLGVLVLGAVAVLMTPSAHAQAKCGTNAICIGGKTTDVRVMGNLVIAGGADGGGLNLTGTMTSNSTTQAGSCTLASGSPSTCTATVKASSKCVCAPVGTTAAIAAAGCAVNLSSTTLTITGPNTVTTVMNYFCF